MHTNILLQLANAELARPLSSLAATADADLKLTCRCHLPADYRNRVDRRASLSQEREREREQNGITYIDVSVPVPAISGSRPLLRSALITTPSTRNSSWSTWDGQDYTLLFELLGHHHHQQQ